jgi:hypothetical protein
VWRPWDGCGIALGRRPARGQRLDRQAHDRPLRLLDVERALLKAALTGAPLGFTIGEQSKREGDRAMADILYLGVTVAFFGLSWLLVRLCERL